MSDDQGKILDEFVQYDKQLLEEARNLRAENERLREALTTIARLPLGDYAPCDTLILTARDALGSEMEVSGETD